MKFLEGFSLRTKNNPEAPALVDENGARVTSYAELDLLSGRVAAKLQSLGLKKDDVVVIRMGRQMEYVAAELGCLKAACPFVPVFPSYPAERVNFIMEDSDAKYLLEEDFFADISSFKPAEPAESSGDDRCLIIYTSGSTGKPKGVLYRVKAFDASVDRLTGMFAGQEKPLYGASAPMSFVALLFEYFTILTLGGCSHILSDEIRTDLAATEDYYAEHRLTNGFINPRMLRLYRNKDSALVRIITGSERVVDTHSPDFEILNMYGASEALMVSCFLIDRKYDNTPIGTAHDSIIVRLLDEDGQEVEGEGEGEICAEGVLPQEYLNRPEDSAERFEKLADGRIRLHTGDIGRRLADGNLLYISRKDWMVKINGQRVEPGEIEATMKTVPAVENAAVREFTAANGQLYLSGYYVASQEIKNMGDLLSEKLPAYMIPAHFIRLAKIPLNVNGKLDRFALPEPDIKENKRAYVAPSSAEEKMLCAAFEKVLNCGRVGIYDDFFALGGDSIKVMELQNICGHPGLSSRLIFSEKTPAGISAALTVEQEDLLGLAMQEERSEYPLTASQMGVYLECLQNPEGTMYNIPLGFSLAKDSGIDIEKLTEAVRAAISNHAALMSRLVLREGMPCFVAHKDSVEISLIQTIDVEQAKKDFLRPFSLDKELYHVQILEGPEEYTVLLDFHHLVFDGTSFSVLLREIGQAYEEKALPAEEATQFNLGVYEEILLHSRDYAAAKDYFDSIYAGLDSNANLVTDFAEDTKLANKPATTITLRSAEGLSTLLLEEFALKNNITVNTVLLGGFEYTLAKFSAETELTLCTVNHGRHDSRLQNTVGMMVRTLPLYVKINEEQRVAEFLQEAQESLLAGMQHDIYPFWHLAEDHGLSADYKFVYQNNTMESFNLGELTIPVMNLPVESAQGKLTVMVFKENSGYRFEITYRSDIFAEENIRSFVQTYLQVLEQFMTAEHLKDVNLLYPSAEQLLDTFNETEVLYDRSKTVVDLFREQAVHVPDNTAVVYLDKSYTYRQVDDLSERIAAYLHAKGIGRDDVVSILIPRCEYMPIAALGVLKSGAAYQPLDPTYPAERLAFMMADASVSFLIAEENLLDLVADFEGEILLTADIPALPAGEAVRNGPRPEDLFILLYTSGTTGRPKGTMLEHGNLTAFCNWYQSYYELTDESRVAAYASFGFDANMMDTYPSLTTGAALHIIPDEIRLDLPQLADYYVSRQITHAFITTQVGRLFAESVESSFLHYLSIGGEKLTPIGPPKDYPLYNLYGPTECTILLTSFLIDKLYMRVPIGKALANTKLYVVDKQGRRLPPGAVGELCGAGHQVGRGYLNLPEQTAAAFVPNPFSNEPDYDRIYRTGDDVRFLPDGNVDFIGRRDGQVKIRGFRIEIEEVEKIILSYPGINNVAVVANDLPDGGGQYLVSYIVSDEDIDFEALHAYIGENKPPYMVPSASMQIEKIPLNVNGKLDRRALPKIEISAEEAVLPKNAFQQKIFDCVAGIIGRDSFGITTDLFAAGLTSISVIRLTAALAKEFGVSVGFAEIRDNETVEKLEALLLSAEAEEVYDIRSEYPLSQTQHGIFVESLKNPHSTIYNIPYLIKAGAGVDVTGLQKAVSDAIDAHPYIKTILRSTDTGEVLALRRDDSPPRVDIISCAYLPEPVAILRPFDLLGKELYRAKIYQTEDGNYLYLDLHHIICDGESLSILLADISLAYAGEVLEKESYTGFEVTLDEEKKLASDAFAKGRAHYELVFAGCDTDFLPVTDKQDETPSVANVRCDSQLTAKALESFCLAHDLSPNAFFNAAMGFVLAEYNHRDDAIFTTVYNGRNDSRLSRTITMLVKTLPVYCNIADNPRVKNYVKAIQDQLMASMAADIFSFAEISAAFGITADILLVYQGEGFIGDSFCGQAYEATTLELDAAKAPLTISLDFEQGKLALSCEYRSDLYEESTVFCLLNCLNTVCHEFLAKDKLSDVELVDAKQLQVLDKFNDTVVEYDRSKTVVDLFCEQAVRTPDNTAVVNLEKSYTYREVDDLSGRIAAYLRGKGIGRDDVVSILIPRCENMPVTALGVLKTGAAYQPLDPTYPAERLAFMMADASVSFLIAEENLLDLLPDFQGEILLTGDIPALPAGDVILDGPRPEDLLILLYTSGTTGRPKGTMLEHGNLTAFCNWYQSYYELTDESRVAAYASFGFDANMMDTYPALITGAAVHIIPDEIRLDLPQLADYYVSQQITHAFITTQVGRLFADSVESSSLHQLSIGGEKLTPIGPPKDYPLYNVYGPTECTILTTAFPIDKLYMRVPIGKALANMKLYVVDKEGRRLPPGAVGELCIAGHQVGRGYLNLPEQTAAAFIANPFSNEPDYDRIYHTGDDVRFLPDGNIDFIGRRDGQVKIRGFRIEVEEVEKIILSYPGINNVAVVANDLPDGGGQCLVAYIVAEERIDIEALHAYIANNKPPYMVPSASMQIEKIPLNVNGKLDRRALPQIEIAAEEIILPKNAYQQKIFDCVAGIIGRDSFGITTDLFAAGLTSISVIRLTAVLAKEFGVSVGFAEIRDNETVEKLEALLLSAEAEEVYDIRSEYPLSQTQQGIFVESLKNPHTTIYNIPYLIKAGAGVNVERLQKAVSDAIDAHPYIKTILRSTDTGEVLALRRDDTDPRVDLISCANLPEKSDLLRPFELIDNELYRAEIYVTKDGNYLFLDLHHILCDGESLSILLADINSAYAGEVLEKESYTGFEAALDEERKLASDAFAKAKEHYDLIFSGCDTDFLPVTDKQDETPSVAHLHCGSELTASDLDRFCQAHAVSNNAFFNAAMGFVLAEYNYRDDAVFATIYNGRNDSRLSRTITMLVKTLPIYCNIAGNPKIKDYVKVVQEQLIDSMAADIFSFAEISASYGITADILLGYQGEGFISDSFCGEAYEATPLVLDAAKAPLSVSLDFEKGRLALHCEYRSDLYNESTVSDLLSCLNTVCREFLAKDELADVELVNAGQLELLDQFNDTAVAFDRSKSTVDLFREQVAQQPEQTAVVYLDKSYTYREVDEISERIGVYLQSKGIGREDVVGILIPRCEYMPIASMGVVKANAAFQPLDPSYPTERLEYMLEDAGVRMLIVAEDLLDLVPAYQGEILLTKDIPALPVDGKCKGSPRPEDLMVLLYTSGTTGKPKGVMLEQRNIAAFCISNSHIMEIGSDIRVAGYASFGFDAGVQDIFATLTMGATLYVIDEKIKLDLPALHTYLNDNRINDIMMTTQMGRMFISDYDFPYLHNFIVGGEKLTPIEPPQTFKIYNGYGPTESMAYITVAHVDKYYDRVPIGKASENIRLYVCDRQGRRLPIGACGELCITGYQVGRGYLNLPEQTAAVFKPNPFSKEEGYERMYHTGDVVRYLPDGNIDFIGRRDGQVKIRGFRIELSEVEQIINSYPGVKNSVVVTKDAADGSKRIVAYIVAEDTIDIEALHAFIAENKPSYMVPSSSMLIDKIPLTVNGKLDKRALPEPEYRSSRKGRAPSTKMEQLFCDIYEEVLAIENISAEDSFFELGGSSLTVTRVIIAANKHEINIAFADVFSHPSPAELAAFVESSSDAGLPEFEDLGAYDYAEIEKVLAKNNLQSFKAGERNPLGKVLLTGVTGYLGIHTLRELLQNYDNTVFCLVRPGAKLSAAERLDSLYFYYFNQVLSEEYSDRIRIIDGDVTDKPSLEACATEEIDTVINCAANIKHFSKGTDIEDVNYTGALNLIALCEQTGARFIQTSTVSVSGMYVDKPGPTAELAENQLYVGQMQVSKYTQSKFKAERVLLEKIAKGFKGKIMRLGNLGPRERDGEYQINFNTNSFMGRLKANIIVGSYPYDVIEMPFELTPIDDLARAILLLSQTPDDCTVFHPYNNHVLMMGDMYEAMNAQNLHSRAVEMEEYESALAEAKQNPEIAEKLAGLLAYENLAHGQKVFSIGSSNLFTMQVLYRMGFRWPVTSAQYMKRFLEALIGLNFFD